MPVGRWAVFEALKSTVDPVHTAPEAQRLGIVVAKQHNTFCTLDSESPTTAPTPQEPRLHRCSLFLRCQLVTMGDE